jgi:hypothetical protein
MHVSRTSPIRISSKKARMCLVGVDAKSNGLSAAAKNGSHMKSMTVLGGSIAREAVHRGHISGGQILPFILDLGDKLYTTGQHAGPIQGINIIVLNDCHVQRALDSEFR